MHAVEVKSLQKVFALRKGGFLSTKVEPVVAIDSIDLTVELGESVAFIGPNGAGKSTTIKILTGIMRPSGGSARVLGLTPWLERARLAYRIGAVFGQRSQLWYHLPPHDSFELLARIYNLPKNDYQQRRKMLIDRFCLGDFIHTSVRKLSLGQRMRAEIAASLLHAPQVIFLDEPTIGLDVIARQELRDLMREWNRDDGITIFLTSHDTGDIENMAKRVLVINHGQVVLDDSVSSMRSRLLGEKVIFAKFQDEPPALFIPGATIIERAEYSLKLKVNTNIIDLNEVITTILKAGRVVDINIEDPPLEEVIARIYNERVVQTSGGKFCRQAEIRPHF